MRRIVPVGLASLLSITPSLALEAPTLAYMRELVRPDRTVLVLEYVDPRLNAAIDRVGLVSRTRFTPLDGRTVRISENLAIRLGSVAPCESDVPIQHEDYRGTCAGLAMEGLAIELRHAAVLLCRAYAEQKDRPVQEATCYSYVAIDNALESVDMLEESVVAGGWAFASRDADGQPMRADLAVAEWQAAANRLVLWSMEPVPLPGLRDEDGAP